MKPISILIQGITLTRVFSSPFDVASEDVGDFKRDDHLESTGWAWLQTDHAYVCLGIVEVQFC
jgi:hypothetical protein